jgi:hypothetical protein
VATNRKKSAKSGKAKKREKQVKMGKSGVGEFMTTQEGKRTFEMKNS